MATIEQFLDLLKYKTNYIVNGYENIDECFNQIDNQCQDFFNLYQETNQQETLSTAITQFSGQLQTLNTSISNSDFSIVLKN
jgi:t-SNARE complex subunit (syntaxin)